MLLEGAVDNIFLTKDYDEGEFRPGQVMVFGFNTDVNHDGVVYHVQTETRKDGGFETVVYRRGEIIHKVTSPSPQPNDSSADEEVRKVLEEQHRQVIDRIRSGELESPTE